MQKKTEEDIKEKRRYPHHTKQGGKGSKKREEYTPEEVQALTQKPGDAFTEGDMYAAEIYYDRRFIKMGRRGILLMTNIDIGVTRRNGQKQKEEEARAIRDIRQRRLKKKWDEQNGRKPKRSVVENWQREHPEGRKADCIRDTGLTRPTVDKYWITGTDMTGISVVRRWRMEHPDGRKINCIRDTGLSKSTVYRNWEEDE